MLPLMEDQIAEYGNIFERCIREGGEKGGHELLHMAMRALCQNDLFYLLAFVLGRVDVRRQWLYERCVDVQAEPDGYLDLWAREHYKALPVNTIVPTPSGYSLHGELNVGDEVFGGDGSPVKIVAKTRVFYGTKCYRITFDDGTSINAGRDHLWEVGIKTRGPRPERKTGRENAIVSTEEIYRMSHAVDNRMSIDMSRVVDLPKKDLPVEPYTLGAWLGDGNSAGPRITCAYDDKGIIDEIAKHYPVKEGKKNSDTTGSFMFGGGVKGKKGSGISPALRGIGVLNNKHIPIDYLRASRRQRMSLLQGLMDTDGSNNTRGTATYSGNSERLVDDVFELCASLGLNPNRGTHTIEVNGEPYPVQRVSFQTHADEPVFRLKRKADRSKTLKPKRRKFITSCVEIESEPVSCIQVANSDGVYLVGKDYLPTHNSTIITFALTIQDILNDPNITVGIFSHTKSISRGFLKQIKFELETNERLKRLFPDILYQDPKKDAPKIGNSWTDEGITVKRTQNSKECTCEAHGVVDGQPTSKHFKLLLYDDIVTLESVSTPEQITKTTGALAISYNLGAHGGRRRWIGTRYHFNDTYKAIIDRGTATPRIHPATDNGKDDGEPVFLEAQALMEKRRDMGPYVFGCQMLQDPTADSAMGFKVEWLKYYETEPELGELNIYILVDPANSKKKASDYTVMWVVGLAPDRNYYLLDGIHDRLNLTQRTDALFQLHQEYTPEGVGYEHFGIQADIQHIESEMERMHYRFNITPLSDTTPKNDRIRRLVPLFEQGRIIMPRSIWKTNYEGKRVNLIAELVNDEYTPFPVMLHDDMLDDLANIRHPKMVMTFPRFVRRQRKESWQDKLRRKLNEAGGSGNNTTHMSN